MCYTRNGVRSAVQAVGSIGSLIMEAAAVAAISDSMETGNYFLQKSLFAAFR